VLTAVALGRSGPSDGTDQTHERGNPARAATCWAALSTSWVTFAPLSAAQIQRYVDSGEPMGKAGAYAIQGGAALWTRHISGSYSGIMGLPAHETAQLLGAAGIHLV
jgi:septum formation protein